MLCSRAALLLLAWCVLGGAKELTQRLRLGVKLLGGNANAAQGKALRVCPGQRLVARVGYEASNGAEVGGLSFKVQYNPSYFSLEEQARTDFDMKKCPIPFLSQLLKLDDEWSYVSFVCADVSGAPVVQPKSDKVLELMLRVRDKHQGGETHIDLIANHKLHGRGFQYKVQNPQQSIKVADAESCLRQLDGKMQEREEL